MNFDHSLLCYFVRDSLMAYSDDFRMLEWGNPVRFSLNGIEYSVHVSYVHDSGNARTNDDEMRIQLQRSIINAQRKHRETGDTIAFIGFFEGGGIFIGWEPSHVLSLTAKTAASVYARKAQIEKTEIHLAAAYFFTSKRLRGESAAISLQSNALGFYLENIERFHSFRTEKTLRNLLKKYTNSPDKPEIASNRLKFTHTHTSYPRNPNFSKNVLAAYKYSCAVCGKQMKIVQAAHIIPHSEEDSSDAVSNGIALCVEHHWLYDTGLLLPGPNKKIIFNKCREQFLRDINQANGIERIKRYENEPFTLPDDAKHHPSAEFLRKGLAIRGACRNY